MTSTAAFTASPTLFEATVMLVGGATTSFDPYRGGWHWQAFAYALWESFLCISMCIGVIYAFRRYLNRSPKRYYMELRLQKARNLLMQTDMSVINVALACGFASPSHFSKCYRAQFGTTPYRERGAQAEPV